jgi:hypothetical protein
MCLKLSHRAPEVYRPRAGPPSNPRQATRNEHGERTVILKDFR